MSLSLGVNIDHVATLRQARYARTPEAENVEPDLLAAALICEQAGAQSITVHLRADRRHLQDRDLARLRESIGTKLNLEMGNTAEILEIALATRPEDVCLVPEGRQEITTEGGLDAHGLRGELRPTIERLGQAGIKVSLFIDPDEAQVRAARDLGAPVIELHTGAFANAAGEQQAIELTRLELAAELAGKLGLQVNAGHGLNYRNVLSLFSIPNLRELNIGHSIVSRAVFVGLESATREMLALLDGYGR